MRSRGCTRRPMVSLQGEIAMRNSELYAKVGPKLKGSLPGPKALAAVAHDDRVISPSYTRSYPLVAKSGKGIRITDVDGNEFMDFAAGIAVNSTGHCHPEVVKAIQEQAAELIHISGTDFFYESMAVLGHRLSAGAPMAGPHKVYYGNSGMGRVSLTGSKPEQKRRFSPLVPGVTHVPYPYVYRGTSGGLEEQEAFALG